MLDAITNPCPNVDAGWANQLSKGRAWLINYIQEKNGFMDLITYPI